MKLQPVPIHESGPATFRCCMCSVRVQQHPEEVSSHSAELRYGTVWADLEGAAFEAYYCTPCVEGLS